LDGSNFNLIRRFREQHNQPYIRKMALSIPSPIPRTRSPSPLIVARLPSLSPSPESIWPPRKDEGRIVGIKGKHVHRNGRVTYTVEWEDGLLSNESACTKIPSLNQFVEEWEHSTPLYLDIISLQEAYKAPANLYPSQDYRPAFGYLSEEPFVKRDAFLQQHLATVNGGELTLKKSLQRQLYRPPGFENAFEDEDFTDMSESSSDGKSHNHSHHDDAHSRPASIPEGQETNAPPISFLMQDFGSDDDDEDFA
jgi:hypothetical protein